VRTTEQERSSDQKHYFFEKSNVATASAGGFRKVLPDSQRSRYGRYLPFWMSAPKCCHL
jgi:hypothetical protein